MNSACHLFIFTLQFPFPFKCMVLTRPQRSPEPTAILESLHEYRSYVGGALQPHIGYQML